MLYPGKYDFKVFSLIILRGNTLLKTLDGNCVWRGRSSLLKTIKASSLHVHFLFIITSLTVTEFSLSPNSNHIVSSDSFIFLLAPQDFHHKIS